MRINKSIENEYKLISVNICNGDITAVQETI